MTGWHHRHKGCKLGNTRRWRRTGEPGCCRVGHNWAAEQQQCCPYYPHYRGYSVILYYPLLSSIILYYPLLSSIIPLLSSIILYYPSIIPHYPSIILYYPSLSLYCPSIIPLLSLIIPLLSLYYPSIIPLCRTFRCFEKFNVEIEVVVFIIFTEHRWDLPWTRIILLLLSYVCFKILEYFQ